MSAPSAVGPRRGGPAGGPGPGDASRRWGHRFQPFSKTAPTRQAGVRGGPWLRSPGRASRGCERSGAEGAADQWRAWERRAVAHHHAALECSEGARHGVRGVGVQLEQRLRRPSRDRPARPAAGSRRRPGPRAPCGLGRRPAARPRRRRPARRSVPARRTGRPAAPGRARRSAAVRPGRRPAPRSSPPTPGTPRPEASTVAGSASIPASASISSASATVSATTSAGPPPRSTSTDSATSSALPTARPSGTDMSVSSAVVRSAARRTDVDHRRRQLRRALRRLHERPGARP